MGKDWDKLAGSFTESKGRGEWAAIHGTSRKGFDGYGLLPTYVGGGNVKCPQCGRPVDGRDPAKPDRRKGYRCVCGGAKQERQRLAAREIQAWHRRWLQDVYRLLVPRAELKVMGGTRVFHRVGAAMKEVGFRNIRLESLGYGSGFPKSMDVSKAIDKAAGVEREVVGVKPGHEEFAGRETVGHIQGFVHGTMGQEGGFARPWMTDPERAESYHMQTAPATDEAKIWDGWHTGLKPSWEPVLVGTKPGGFTEGNMGYSTLDGGPQ